MATAFKEEKKQLARESHKIRRAREKLKRILEENDRAMTVQALQQKTVEIHRWIARHAPYRVVLRTKNISLFDENQNTAKLSRRVEEIACKVKELMIPVNTSLSDRKIELK